MIKTEVLKKEAIHPLPKTDFLFDHLIRDYDISLHCENLFVCYGNYLIGQIINKILLLELKGGRGDGEAMEDLYHSNCTSYL